MKVNLIVGVGDFFGSGHLVRMTELYSHLHQSGYDPFLHEIKSYDIANNYIFNISITEKAELFILDARDIDPEPFLRSGQVLAIDNRFKGRSRLEAAGTVDFFDTIPHPEADFDQTMKNFLISGDLKRDKKIERKDQILIYSGNYLVPENVINGIEQLILMGHLSEAVHVGKFAFDFQEIKAVERYKNYPRLNRDVFVETIFQSKYVFTYFGITLFEAWFSGAIPVSFSVHSEDHDCLSQYLAKRAGIKIIEHGENNWTEKFTGGNIDILPNGPGGHGFEYLMNHINALVAATNI